MPESLNDLIGTQASALLTDARGALSDLVAVADGLDPRGEAAKHARLVREHLDEFFLMVVVGEVKSGKSSFINALLGERVQAEGPLPVTDRVWILKHGDVPGESIQDEYVLEKVHPNPLLKLFHVVDTPGTNSIVRRHQEITESFIPKADLTLFVTSIDRPFSESEHQFLNLLSDRWRKNVLFVLTKTDAREPGEVPAVVDYIKENCKRFYRFEARVFPVSAKRAMAAKAAGDAVEFEKSGMLAIERFLGSSLAEKERVRLKITSPASAGLAVLDELTTLATERRTLLDSDFTALNDLDQQLKQSAKELKERSSVYVVQLYDLLREFERRGRNFFEATIRAQNFGLLRNSQAFQARFRQEVVSDLSERIESVMHAGTDWLMKEQIGLFERSLRFLSDKLAVEKYQDRVAARSPQEQTFEYHRDHLVESIKSSFKREIERFDPAGECNRIMETAYRALLAQIGVQVGAVGLGTLLVTLLTGLTLDVTGVLFAGAVFATGFIILPRKKKKAIQEFSMKVDVLIREFRRELVTEFDREIEQTIGRLRSGYEPFLTFYRAETTRIAEAEERQKAIRVQLLQVIESARSLETA